MSASTLAWPTPTSTCTTMALAPPVDRQSVQRAPGGPDAATPVRDRNLSNDGPAGIARGSAALGPARRDREHTRIGHHRHGVGRGHELLHNFVGPQQVAGPHEEARPSIRFDQRRRGTHAVAARRKSGQFNATSSWLRILGKGLSAAALPSRRTRDSCGVASARPRA